MTGPYRKFPSHHVGWPQMYLSLHMAVTAAETQTGIEGEGAGERKQDNSDQWITRLMI